MRVSQAKGGMMRVERLLVALLVPAAMTAAGCHNNLFQGPDPKGCEQGRLAYNLPPAERLMEPGPGVGGPGPGVIPPIGGGMGMGMGMGMRGMMADPAVMQAGFNGGGCAPGCGYGGGGMAMAGGGGTSQIAFLGDDGMQVSWDVSGSGMFDSSPLVIPGRQDFYARRDLPLAAVEHSGPRASNCSRRWKSRRSLRGPMPTWLTRRFRCSSRKKISTR